MFVALGILSGVFAVGALANLAMAFSYPSEGGTARVISLLAAFLPFIIFVWLAFHLIRYRVRYSDLVFPNPEPDSNSIGAADLHVVGLSLIGVFLIATAIPQFIAWIAAAIASAVQAASHRSIITGESSATVPVMPYNIGEILSSFAQLTIGVLLVAWRLRITTFLFRKKQPRPSVQQMMSCPNCGSSYDPSDYQDGAEAIFCSKCKAELPRDHV